jgi:hypothetical protein
MTTDRGIFPGRYTANPDRSFVVFIIGMRVNRWWKVWLWLPVALAMPRMLAKLRADPTLGMVGGESFFRLFPTTTAMISYWESFEHLDRFATGKSLPHVAAWSRFVQTVGNGGDVGIYHETYRVERGGHECVYVNMPRFGLSLGFPHAPIRPDQNAARDRLGPSAE